MAYQVLARKWRPKRFKDVIGQNHITRSLQNAILRDKIGQAYIFTGTRGIGKTSIARLFAKALRCENRDEDSNPCNECMSCLDFDTGASMNVREIDGASNNGVENIRDLISEVQYLPSVGRYKIYIIDEVHMVTTQAFNALLKTLEEPPEHVIFIFATTEPEKLLGTVLSRCQRFDFRHATVADLTNHLIHIAGEEKITYDNVEHLKQIAIQGKGSVRDTLSLLDQVTSFTTSGHITEETLVVSLGLARSSVVDDIIDHLLMGHTEDVSEKYRSLVSENVSVKNISTALLEHFFMLINSHSELDFEISSAELFWIYETLAKDFSWALESIDPEKVVEVILQKVCLRRTFFNKTNIESTPKKKTDLNTHSPIEDPAIIDVEEPTVIDIVEPPIEYAPAEDIIIKDEPIFIEEFNEPVTTEIQIPIEDEQEEFPAIEGNEDKSWDGLMSYLNEHEKVMACYLESGNIIDEVEISDTHLSLTIGFNEVGATFYDYFCEKENKEKLEELLSRYFVIPIKGVNLQIKYIEDSSFVSVNEIDLRNHEKMKIDKRNEFSGSEVVKEFEHAFDGKLVKVIIPEDEQ